MNHRHQVFGLILDSDLACPELLPAPSGVAADIQIRSANLGLDREEVSGGQDQARIAPGVYEFSIAAVARYRVEAGQRILVDPLPQAAPGDVRLWLLGTALGALLHQRGLLPLHVSALALDGAAVAFCGDSGAAVAFCGDSGAGKSTLAAALHRRGLPLLTDDVGLAVPEGDRVLFYPGFPRLKLWRDALDHFGLDHRPLIRDLTRAEKYHLRLDASTGFQTQAMPLRHLYLLEPGADETITIQPVRGHQAIALIRDHTYRRGLIRELGQAGEHLRQCGRIARGIGVFRLRRPWGLERLEAGLDALLGHLGGYPPARLEP